jgi:hypothetical protein
VEGRTVARWEEAREAEVLAPRWEEARAAELLAPRWEEAEADNALWVLVFLRVLALPPRCAERPTEESGVEPIDGAEVRTVVARGRLSCERLSRE